MMYHIHTVRWYLKRVDDKGGLEGARMQIPESWPEIDFIARSNRNNSIASTHPYHIVIPPIRYQTTAYFSLLLAIQYTSHFFLPWHTFHHFVRNAPLSTTTPLQS